MNPNIADSLKPGRTTPGEQRSACLFLIAAVALVAGAFLNFIWRHYYIKAYSDPYNWLMLSRSLHGIFAGGESVPQLAPGYPCFLWLITKLTGPYWVFLSNVPLLLVLATLVGWLTVRVVREQGDAGEAALAGVAAMAMLLRFDPEQLLALANPYRDPLAQCLLLTSVLTLIRAVRGSGSLPLLGLSGLALGLATSVREPSLLLAPVLLVYGLLAWFGNRQLPLWKAVIVFAIGLAVGGSLLALQSYLSTGQALLPAYSVNRGALVPGFNISNWQQTVWRFLAYIWIEGGFVLVAGWICGVVAAVRARNRVALGVLLPALLVFGVFYSGYWTFMRRYFHVISLFAIPVAVFGMFTLLRHVLRVLHRERWSRAAGMVLAALLVLRTVVGLSTFAPHELGLRLAGARAFTHDVEACITPDSMVYCERNLCEFIRYFTHVRAAYPAWNELDPLRRTDEALRRRAHEHLDAGRAVYSVEYTSPDSNRALLLRYFDLQPDCAFQPADNGLESICGAGPISFARVLPWTNRVTRQTLAAAPAGGFTLRINARMLSQDTDRTWARLYWNGTLLDAAVGDGLRYYATSNTSGITGGELVLESDAPVPASLDAVALSPKDPLRFDFGAADMLSHDAWLDAASRNRAATTTHARTLTVGTVLWLPAPWPSFDRVIVEARARGAGTVEGEWPTGNFVRVVYPLAEVQNGAARVDGRELAAALGLGNDLDNSDFRIEVDVLTLHPLHIGDRFDIDVGGPADDLFLSFGFFNDEPVGNQGARGRWTAGKAELDVYIRPPQSDLLLSLEYWWQHRSAAAPPDNIVLHFNGQALDARRVAVTDSNAPGRITARLPAASIRAGTNKLTIQADPWVPKDFIQTRDNRQLGILVDAVHLEAIPPELAKDVAAGE